MSDTRVTRDGVEGERPGREARVWESGGRRRRGGAERAMVPDAEFRSYYGRPVLKVPVWKKDIPAYFFTGGLAATSSVLAAGADVVGLPALRRVGRLGAFGGITVSTYFLINDLGRPERFHHMLRVLRPSSPMSVGSWLLAAYGPAAGLAGAAEVVDLLRGRTDGVGDLARGLVGEAVAALARPAGAAAAALAPAVATYTAVLTSDTAVPAWHEVHRELPFVFAGSAAAAGAGLALVAVPVGQAGPARSAAVGGVLVETAASQWMERRRGLVAEPYSTGRAGRLVKAAQVLGVGGALLAATAASRSRAAAVAAGVALLAGSALLRFGVFEAGVQSAADPRYTVVPQRERLAAR